MNIPDLLGHPWTTIFAQSLIILFVVVFPLAAIYHCLRNARVRPIAKLLLTVLMAVLGPFMALPYTASTDGSRRLRNMGFASAGLAIIGVFLLYMRFQMFGYRMAHSERKATEIGLAVPTNLPSTISDLTQKQKEYQHLERLNQWSMIITSFNQDQTLLSDSSEPNRKALTAIMPTVALAYREKHDLKKAAYYYAVAGKLASEQSGGVSYQSGTYLDMAHRLDPHNPAIQEILNKLSYTPAE
jgi:hypothetical protein